MKQFTMEQHGHGNVLMMTLTIVLYFMDRFSITQWAGVAAIAAALSTIWVNYHKYKRERRIEKEFDTWKEFRSWKDEQKSKKPEQ